MMLSKSGSAKRMPNKKQKELYTALEKSYNK